MYKYNLRYCFHIAVIKLYYATHPLKCIYIVVTYDPKFNNKPKHYNLKKSHT